MIGWKNYSRVFLFLLIVCGGQAAAEDWKFVTRDASNKFYVDMESVYMDKGVLFLHTKSVNALEREPGQMGMVFSERFGKDRTYTLLSMVFETRDGHFSGATTVVDRPTKKPIEPGTYREMIWLHYFKPSKSSNAETINQTWHP
jgi:hypothetical protein